MPNSENRDLNAALVKDMPPEAKHVTEAKVEALDELAEAKAPLGAREVCYRRCINHIKRCIADYYRRYPERAVDERSKDAEEWSFNAFRDVLHILDQFDIAFKPDGLHKP